MEELKCLTSMNIPHVKKKEKNYEWSSLDVLTLVRERCNYNTYITFIIFIVFFRGFHISTEFFNLQYYE